MEILVGNVELCYFEVLFSVSVMVDGYFWGGGCFINNVKGYVNFF